MLLKTTIKTSVELLSHRGRPSLLPCNHEEPKRDLLQFLVSHRRLHTLCVVYWLVLLLLWHKPRRSQHTCTVFLAQWYFKGVVRFRGTDRTEVESAVALEAYEMKFFNYVGGILQALKGGNLIVDTRSFK